jgi:hypothetical protein
MEDFADFHAAITMRIGTVPRGDHLAAALLAFASQLRVMVLGTAKHIAYPPGNCSNNKGATSLSL